MAISEDSFAQGDGTADLIWGWCGSLYDLSADYLRVCWGGREASKVFVDLGRGRGWGG